VFSDVNSSTSIFVPSEANPLVDILLARGINGESPSKKRAAARLTKIGCYTQTLAIDLEGDQNSDTAPRLP
jgi:hypothetical protein